MKNTEPSSLCIILVEFEFAQIHLLSIYERDRKKMMNKWKSF